MASITQLSPAAYSYAQALLDLADKQNIAPAVAADMAALRQTFEQTPSLRDFFQSPAIRSADREGVLERALIKQVQPLTGNFLRLLSAKGKLDTIPAVAAALAELLDKRSGKADVRVTVSRLLSPGDLEIVRQRISTAIQKEAVITQDIDPNMIGGVRIRIGDKLIDGSVSAQLHALEQKMLAAS